MTFPVMPLVPAEPVEQGANPVGSSDRREGGREVRGTELRDRTHYPREQDLVFCHPETGHPLDRSKLVRRFHQALDRAEVRTITFHELRHTVGARMAAAGIPLRTLQQWMGHADAKTTQVYSHYQPSEDEAGVVDRACA
jgi:integrase